MFKRSPKKDSSSVPDRPESIDEMRRRMLDNAPDLDNGGGGVKQRPRAQSVEGDPSSKRTSRWGRKQKKKKAIENNLHYLDNVPDTYVQTDDDVSRASSRVSQLSGMSIFNYHRNKHPKAQIGKELEFDNSFNDSQNIGANGTSLAAVSDIEKLAQKKGSNPLDEKFKVMPDEAYPNTYYNREELRNEMNKKSAYFHDLRLTTKRGQELGQMRLEILQCFGIPTASIMRETSAYCIAVCGAYAFKTDIMPPVANPIWLRKMRRACLFPLFHGYARIYIGVFDNNTSSDSGSSSDFAGRIVLDMSRLRPGCTYDVTLPLRQSAHVFSREQRGSIRVRFHLSWTNERDMILSYIPKQRMKFSMSEKNTINCLDERSFRNVAQVVHGRHMPGKFSMTLLKATTREINFLRIHIFRYLYKREIYHIKTWEYPVISGFIFIAWMHAVYYNTIQYIPGHIITFLLIHLWKNYAYYIVITRELKGDAYADNGHVGFLPATVEELFTSLLRATKRRKIIKPLDMETDDTFAINPLENMDAHDDYDDANYGVAVPLTEVAESMRKSLRTTNHSHNWKTYKNCFKGNEAVDFLVTFGFASCREEAIQLGRRLQQESKLFEHITQSYDFDDEPHYYQFLDYDTKRYIIKGHIPAGKHIFTALGFYRRTPQRIIYNKYKLADDNLSIIDETPTYLNQQQLLQQQQQQKLNKKKNKKQKHQEQQNQIDDSERYKRPVDPETLHHCEFPFATGQDHPRFTVKESLVIRSAQARKILKQKELDEEVADCAQFGVAPVIHGAAGGVGGKGTPDKRKREEDENIRRSMQSMKLRVSMASMGQVTNVADPEEIYSQLEGTSNPSLEAIIQEQRMANAQGEHDYDSDEDVEQKNEKSRTKRGVVVEEKILKKPPNQDMARKGYTTKGNGDKSFSKVLQQSRYKAHALLLHLFNDHVYKVDEKLFPKTIPKEDTTKDKKKKFKRKSVFGLPLLNNEKDKEEERRKKREQQKTPYDLKLDEYDRILQLNKYSHANPFMNRVAVIVQPIIEIAQGFIAVFRSLFNIFTWQDPILTFWIAFIGPFLVLLLHFAPWRLIFGFFGIMWVGPQNWMIRLLRERSPNYEPRDFDKIIKKKKIPKEPIPGEIPYFSEEAPGNRLLFFKNIDPLKVKQIVVPYGQLKYQRFYDWPPEPEYARVNAGPPPKNDRARYNNVEGDEEADYDTDASNNSYWFDPTASSRTRKKKKKGMKKVASQAKKGAKRGAGAVVGAGGAVVGGVVNTTKGTTKVVSKVSKATVKGTAKVTTETLKGAAKVSSAAVRGTTQVTTGVVKGAVRKSGWRTSGSGGGSSMFRKKKSGDDDDDDVSFD